MALRELSNFKRVQQWNTMCRVWYLYDAKWQNPFHSADKLGKYLVGRNKPIYHQHSDVGDHVVVINTRQIALPNDEWLNRVYFHHTGYPGGATWTLAWELHQKEPTLVLYKAVYRSLSRIGLLRPPAMARLHLYPDEEVPEDILGNVTAQIRQLRPQPKTLDKYSKEELNEFPRVFDWPKDHIIKKTSSDF